MAAYFIFIRERMREADAMETYTKLAGPSLDGHPVKVLAAYGPQQVVEGAEAEGVVLVEFPTVDAAKAWYDGPAYREAREHRFRGADYRAILFEGV
jgi:uncharacterized protein (DUF1330 family)